jgi:SAM-dependent methyltransferase
MSTQNEFYDRFFSKGGWKYDSDKERVFLEERIFPAAGWKQGATILELGAGIGLHAELIRQSGYKVIALEASSSGVRMARKRFPNLNIVCADASKWRPQELVDHIFVRGMSYYHYELLGKNCQSVDVPAETERFFKWLRPGGTFVLQIVTDFGGGKADTGVHMNKLRDYITLFQRFGQIVACTDWSGRPLPWNDPSLLPNKTDRGIILVTRKATN